MVGQIFLNENERLQIDDRELSSGDTLEALIVDGADGKAKWIATSVEHNGSEYYLTGLIGYNPLGLFGKIQ